jgi:PBP1b-binding outer membrane lipoprotein LpoB
MVRWPLLALLSLVAGCVCACGESSSSVTPAEEEAYKHPQKPDLSKIPPGTIKMPSVPAYYGKPSGATGGGAKPPPVAPGG